MEAYHRLNSSRNLGTEIRLPTIMPVSFPDAHVDDCDDLHIREITLLFTIQTTTFVYASTTRTRPRLQNTAPNRQRHCFNVQTYGVLFNINKCKKKTDQFSRQQAHLAYKTSTNILQTNRYSVLWSLLHQPPSVSPGHFSWFSVQCPDCGITMLMKHIASPEYNNSCSISENATNSQFFNFSKNPCIGYTNSP